MSDQDRLKPKVSKRDQPKKEAKKGGKSKVVKIVKDKVKKLDYKKGKNEVSPETSEVLSPDKAKDEKKKIIDYKGFTHKVKVNKDVPDKLKNRILKQNRRGKPKWVTEKNKK